MKKLLSALGTMAVLSAVPGGEAWAANPSNGLRLEPITAYNLVVDSNVGTPASYSPRSAYLGVKLFNDGSSALTDLTVSFGDFKGGLSAPTPGIYPARTNPTPLTGIFYLTHEGGTIGLADATRYVGTLNPGESRTVYWLVSYPLLDDNGDPVFGAGSDPSDDLWVDYDIWATAKRDVTPVTADVRRTLTFRNEISAMANKILPNTANKVPQYYQDLLAYYAPSWTNGAYDGTAGTKIVTEGIWYDLGNVGAGFDNDGDFVPDRNAWLQPIGDPELFDASSFRLANTKVLIVIKLNDGTEVVYTDVDQLYFTQIPENNRGAIGYVAYSFEVLKPDGYSQLTPYQEVASGYDNEKFNGDYGATLGYPLTSQTNRMTMDKIVDRTTASPGDNVLWTIGFTNAGAVEVGNPSVGMPLVIQDAIPTGTFYVAGSATNNWVFPTPGVTNYTVFYSTNAGADWLTTEPAGAEATNVTHLQWWLSDPMQTGTWGSVEFRTTVRNPYTDANPLIFNTAGLSFGNTTPFLEDTTNTLVLGNNAIGDQVFLDDGSGGGFLGNLLQDGTEPGISNVTVRLYFDGNSNGVYDAADFLVATTNSSASGFYTFTNLFDGYYIVSVSKTDSALPYGSTPTTPTFYAVSLDPGRATTTPVSVTTADFGFIPVLAVSKTLPTTNDLREGDTITYTIAVTNRLPGNGAGSGAGRSYTVWAKNGSPYATGQKDWINSTNAYNAGEPDNLYAETPMAAAPETLGLSNFYMAVQSGGITNVKAVMRLRKSAGTFDNNDSLKATVNVTGGSSTTVTYHPTNFLASWQDVEIDVTTNKTWVWTDFGTNSPNVLLLSDGKPSDPGTVQLDGVYFKVTTDSSVGTASDDNTLDPVPLWDTYVTNRLQFLYSSPPADTNYVTSVTNGILYWDNVGPIYAGGAAVVTATFRVLEPPNNATNNVTNTTWVSEATYRSGLPANKGTSTVVRTVLPAGTIGDYIFRDLGTIGAQDGADIGVANVAVRLQLPDGTSQTNYTDATGYYYFTGLTQSGSYTTTVLTATLPGGSGTNTYDYDGNNNNQTIVSLTFDATNGLDTVLYADFGYNLLSAIEGTVWNDLNRSATTNRDAGEPWLQNVVVALYSNGNIVVSSSTDSNGFFRFTGNFVTNNGTYEVQVITIGANNPLATGTWTQSFDTDTTNTANSVTISNLVSGGVARADYSYFQTGTFNIGDELYYDWNGDGARNSGEEGITNITIRLYQDLNSNGVIDAGTDLVIATTATSTNGTYGFNGYPAGYYIVVVDESDPQFPPLYLCTDDPVGAMDGQAAFNLAASRDDIDFGYQPYGTAVIGDTVWRDVNGDGLQAGPTETGIGNISVSLQVDRDGNGTFTTISNAVTDANGEYLFTSLPDGIYRVVVDTADTDLPTDAFGNRWQPSTPSAFSVTVSGGGSYLGADFGFTGLGAIGDTVFWDVNGNGMQDYGEGGVAYMGVTLYDATTNTVLATTNTDANGVYLFPLLTNGSYVVVVSQTGALATATCTADPDVDVGETDPLELAKLDGRYAVTIGAGQVFLGADFGYKPPSSLGDTLWIDYNTNGVQDVGELGLPGVPVTLYSNGVSVSSTVTDPDGKYYFYNFLDGTYYVSVDTANSNFPSGLLPVYDPDAVLDSVATNIVVAGGLVTTIDGLVVTNANLAIDFGYRYFGSNVISGTIGLDAPVYDGLLNGSITSGVSATEAPFPGVPVYLTLWIDSDLDGAIDPGETDPLASTTTATNGDYVFTGVPSLPPSGGVTNYFIVSMAVPYANLDLTTEFGNTPALRVVESTNALGNTVSAYQVVANAPETSNIDFAFKSTVPQDFGDLPSSYGTLLQDAFEGARHTLAGTNLYLGAGVNVDAEDNGFPTADATGDNTNNVDDETGVMPLNFWTDGGTGAVQVTVGAGSGWLVGWVDFNGDGAFTNVNEMVVSQSVSPGVYTNRFEIPVGTMNPTNATPLYARFRLFPSQPAFPALAFYGPADNGEVEDYHWIFGAIGDMVWYDANANGVKESTELGISDATVFVDLDNNGLFDSNSEPSYVTGTSGVYRLTGLLPDTYVIRVDTNTIPSFYYATYDKDSQLVSPDSMTTVTLASGDTFTDVDFGYDSTPTLVTIFDVRAYTGADGAVRVQWSTAMEIDTLGFHVERWDGAGWTRLNASLIPALFWLTPPNTYETVDPAAVMGGTYTWRIVEIDVMNRELVYGPFTLTVDGRNLTYEAWASDALVGPVSAGRDADPDGDGLTNFEEYLAGTNPLDINSLLAITALESRPADGAVTIRWNSEPGMTYGVEISTDLGQGFVPFRHGIEATPPVNTLDVPVAPDKSLYFRIIVE